MPTKAELMQVLTSQQSSDVAVKVAIETAQNTNSALLAIGCGMIALSGVAYIWYRRISSDKREDGTLRLILDESAKAAQMWRVNAEDANKRADDANARADKIREDSMATIERVAKERNEAVQEVGALRRTVEHLQETVNELTVENKSLHETLDGQGVLLRQVLLNQATIYDKFDIKMPEVPKVEETKETEVAK